MEMTARLSYTVSHKKRATYFPLKLWHFSSECYGFLYQPKLCTTCLMAWPQGQYWIAYLSTTNNSNYQYGRC